jgi:hypothetical protein
MQRDDSTEKPSVEQRPLLPLYAPEPDSQASALADDPANETVEEGTTQTLDWLLVCMMETYN